MRRQARKLKCAIVPLLQLINSVFFLGFCGQILPPPLFRRVINGHPSLHPGDWPWLLSIKDWGQHNCGASLITDEWAVTAAHCFFIPNDPLNRMVDLLTIDVVAGK